MKQPVLPHGGDWAGYEAEYGGAPLDFSANVSPLGTPAAVRQAICTAAETAYRYPDPLCRELCAAIAAKENVGFGQVLCGNGAADIIYRLAPALRPARALIAVPTFAEYEAALALYGCGVEKHLLQEANGFGIGEDFIDRIVPGVGLVLLCEPNNPTGITTPRPLLRRILSRCEQVGARLVIDECFNDFLDDPAAHTMARELASHPALIILRAFTKLYAMAGVRLGYCLCADEKIIEKLRAAGQPWAVSGPAQAAGLAALEQTEYVAAVRALIAEQRPRMAAALAALGFTVVPGQANYLLFKSEKPLLLPLRRQGILLRGCGNYQGLDDRWYRTAVRTEEENSRLLAALERIVAETEET